MQAICRRKEWDNGSERPLLSCRRRRQGKPAVCPVLCAGQVCRRGAADARAGIAPGCVRTLLVERPELEK